MSSPISERVQETRAACLEALAVPPLAMVEVFLDRQGYSLAQRLDWLRATAQVQSAAPALIDLERAVVAHGGPAAEPGALARALLVRAGLAALDQIPDLPLDESVKCLFCKEFRYYADPPPAARASFALNTYAFTAMSQIALLRRFPAGQQQWEVSGFRRKWLLQVRPGLMAKTYAFLAARIGGLKPYFVTHMAVTSHRIPFLIEREYLKSFYRMAAAIEKQPGIKAIMGASWLHSLETHRVSPHLAFLNRPHLEAGGIYTDLGPIVSTDAGFLAGDKERAELYRTGRFKPTLGVVLCTREQAISWKRSHSELEPLVAVR